jgi:hypothetical protein
MPTFRIVQYRDAVQVYEVALEAETAEAALTIAADQPCASTPCGAFDRDSAEMEVRDEHGATLIPAHEVW